MAARLTAHSGLTSVWVLHIVLACYLWRCLQRVDVVLIICTYFCPKRTLHLTNLPCCFGPLEYSYLHFSEVVYTSTIVPLHAYELQSVDCSTNAPKEKDTFFNPVSCNRHAAPLCPFHVCLSLATSRL